jgi:hypothetical protein
MKVEQGRDASPSTRKGSGATANPSRMVDRRLWSGPADTRSWLQAFVPADLKDDLLRVRPGSRRLPMKVEQGRDVGRDFPEAELSARYEPIYQEGVRRHGEPVKDGRPETVASALCKAEV